MSVPPRTKAEELLDEYGALLRSSLPADTAVFDAHVHLGRDDDGANLSAHELVETFERFGVQGGFVFCMNEPDRAPAFRAANDRTLAAAQASGGKLVPFARLDLADGAGTEATRAFGRGARGIKLHTRAQPLEGVERELAHVFELAAERRAPILVHGGLGMPPIAGLLCGLAERVPESRLIIAHGGIADLARFAERLGGRPGAYFDTSVWSPFDLLAVSASVPPEQVLYGSDMPYGQLPNMLLLALWTARASNWTDDDVQGLMGRNALGIAAGAEPAVPTSPLGEQKLALSLVQLRVHHYLASALRMLWSRRSGADALVELAEAAWTPSGASADRVRRVLASARELWREAVALQDDGERRRLNRTVFQLLHLADVDVVLGGDAPEDGDLSVPALAASGRGGFR